MKNAYVYLLIAILLSGCTEMDAYYDVESGEVIRYNTLGLDSECDPTDEGCVCMVCEQDLLLFDLENPFNRFYSLDLDGAECRFETGCTKERFEEIAEAPGLSGLLFGEEQLRFFMLGQGSNFAEFADANRYCNNSLRLAVRWLSSTDGYEYPMPSADRAECMLEKDVMPVYLLHSQETTLDEPGVRRAASIAEEFEDSGPVILISEFDVGPELDNRNNLAWAVEQAIQMKTACPDCLIGVAPRLEYIHDEVEGKVVGYNYTYDAIDYIFNRHPKAELARTSIDLVAVGLNSHHMRTCSSDAMIWDAVAYSKFILENYEKPSLWAYVLVDEGGYNAGGVTQGTCTWSSSEATKTYADLYKYMSSLIRNGVIGAAPYSLYGVDTGPLECGSCGMMDTEGNTYPPHTVWFSLCQVYYTRRGITPIVFSPTPCANCDFANNYNRFQLTESYYGTTPDADALAGKVIQPYATFYRCSGQMMTEVPEEIELPDYSASDEKCELYPELDVFSDIRDSDPVLTRAIAWMESGLNNPTEGPGGDMCEASQLPASQCNDCVDTLNDPQGLCTQNAGPGNEFHSVGIMQTHTYPYTQWLEVSNVHYEEEARWCGKDEFNPFNKAHNACLGTAIILDKLRYGREWVSDNEAKLELTALQNEYGEESHEYLNMKNAITIFVSSYYYSGWTTFQNQKDNWLGHFVGQKEVTEEECEVGSVSGQAFFDCCEDGELVDGPCCNNKVFINYIQDCEYPDLTQTQQQKAKYGINVLAFYKALLECEKYDEDQHEQNLIDYLDKYEGDTDTESDLDE